MYIAIDIILVAIMIATVYGATKRGFVLSLFSLITVAVSLIVAWTFYGQLGAYINAQYVGGFFEAYAKEHVLTLLEQNSAAIESGALIDSLPEGFVGTANLLGVDIAKTLSDVYTATDELVTDAASSLSSVISNIIAFAVIFFAAFVILKVMGMILNKFAEADGIRKFNMFFGFLLGSAEALVLGVLVSKAAIAILGAYGAFLGDAELMDAAQKTVVAKFLVSIFPF